MATLAFAVATLESTPARAARRASTVFRFFSARARAAAASAVACLRASSASASLASAAPSLPLEALAFAMVLAMSARRALVAASRTARAAWILVAASFVAAMSAFRPSFAAASSPRAFFESFLNSGLSETGTPASPAAGVLVRLTFTEAGKPNSIPSLVVMRRGFSSETSVRKPPLPTCSS